MKCDTAGCKKEAVTNMLIRDHVKRPIIVIRVCKDHLKKLYDSKFFEGELLKEQRAEAEKILGKKCEF